MMETSIFFSIRLGINWTESRQIFNEAVAHYFPAESNEIQQLADRITLGAVVIARPINIYGERNPIASVGEKMHREDFVVTQNVTGSNYALAAAETAS
jgi:hypothetical protein